MPPATLRRTSSDSLPTRGGDADLLDLTRDLVRRRSSAPRPRRTRRQGRFPREVFRTAGQGRPAGPALPRGVRRRRPAVRGLPAGRRGAGGRLGSPSASGVSVHTLACFPLAAFGTDEQRDALLPDMLGGELLGAYCLSEPQSGSDAAALTHPGRARRRRATSSTAPRPGSPTAARPTSTRSCAAPSDDGRAGHLLPARPGRHRRAVGRARPSSKMGLQGLDRPRRCASTAPGSRRRPADGRRRARASRSRWPRWTAAGSASPPAPSALAQAALDAAAGLRHGAPAVRPADRRLPGAVVHARRHGHPGRGGPGALPGGGPAARRGPAVRQAGRDGQAVLHRHGDAGHHRRRPGPRRLRLRRGLPGRALHARGQGRCRSSRAPTRSSGWSSAATSLAASSPSGLPFRSISTVS